jgi:hypothetical protein
MTSQRATGPSEEAMDHTPLAFGKHVGKTPEEIAEIDPSYILWLYTKTEGNVSRALYAACRDDIAEGDSDDERNWERP